MLQLPNKDFLTLAEIAKALDRHVATIARWAIRGVRGQRLPTILIGGRRMCERSAILAFFAAINGNGPSQPSVGGLGRNEEWLERALQCEKL